MKRLIVLLSLSLASCKSSNVKVNQIQGDWALSVNDNVSFSIKKDSIYYPEYEGKFNIKIFENKIEVLEEGHLVNNFEIVKASKDSLFLKLQNGKVEKYIKILE